jgi:hypothetical protein
MKSMRIFSYSLLSISLILLLFSSCSTSEKKVVEQKLEVNGGTLYFTENVDSAQAIQLADFLAKDNLYFDGTQRTVKLDKKGDTFLFMAKLDDKAAADSNYIVPYKAMGKIISQQVLTYQPVEVHLCNEKFETVRRIPFTMR